jgi:hypothetical protein
VFVAVSVGVLVGVSVGVGVDAGAELAMLPLKSSVLEKPLGGATLDPKLRLRPPLYTPSPVGKPKKADSAEICVLLNPPPITRNPPASTTIVTGVSKLPEKSVVPNGMSPPLITPLLSRSTPPVTTIEPPAANVHMVDELLTSGPLVKLQLQLTHTRPTFAFRGVLRPTIRSRSIPLPCTVPPGRPL